MQSGANQSPAFISLIPKMADLGKLL